MKIDLIEIPIRDLIEGYQDSEENGVWGYGGQLNIRPKFQREFVYKDAQRDAVINTVMKGFPLNTMYWVKSKSGEYELLDGQQRTMSICQFANKEFSVNFKFFHNLTDDERERFLNYKLMIYVCEGDDSEKLDWFRTINIAGEKLTEQELRNATYAGTWLTDAKKHFSKTNSAASSLAGDYINGVPIRQEQLEIALDWIAKHENKTIEDYMGEHQEDQNANELWLYFQEVINWAKLIFPEKRKELKVVPWGPYYDKFKNKPFDAKAMEEKIKELMQDEDVTKKSGIYEYLMDGNEKHLNIRKFSDKVKREVYEKQDGVCVKCGKIFEIEEMDADHITPWSKGGKTVSENCQLLCKSCNRTKSNK